MSNLKIKDIETLETLSLDELNHYDEISTPHYR